MKTVLTFIAVFFLAASTAEVQAQDLTKMLTDITEGISPDAFTKKFAKGQADWSDALKTMDPTDLTAVTDQVGGLVKGLKPGAFAKGAHK